MIVNKSDAAHRHAINKATIAINWDKVGIFYILKVRKEAKLRKRYNQVPHLTQDTLQESNKNTIDITNKNQEVRPFQAVDHKAAMNRGINMRNTRHKNKNDPQKKYRLGAISKIFYWRA